MVPFCAKVQAILIPHEQDSYNIYLQDSAVSNLILKINVIIGAAVC